MNNVLVVENLKKCFPSTENEKKTVPIVDIPHFILPSQAQVGIEGLSGSGKTTFLNLIAGILSPDGGKIVFEGTDVAFWPEPQRDLWRAEHIGYVFQTFNLLQGYTALENVMLGMAFGKGVDQPFAEALLKRMNLSKYLQSKPRQMSIGQQQRVAVARALANKPKLVLADEPTGNLDRGHAHETIELIQEVCRENGAALLLVSHDQEILGRFKTVVRMSQMNKAVKI